MGRKNKKKDNDEFNKKEKQMMAITNIRIASIFFGLSLCGGSGFLMYQVGKEAIWSNFASGLGTIILWIFLAVFFVGGCLFLFDPLGAGKSFWTYQ